MPIAITCPDCRSQLQIPAQQAGQVIPCPECGRPLTVSPAPPAIRPRVPPPPLPPEREEKIQPPVVDAELLEPDTKALDPLRKRQLIAGILSAVITLALVLGGLRALGFFPRHSSHAQSLEAQARKAVQTALESWRFGDNMANIRKENIRFYDYDRIFCDARLVRFEIGKIERRNDTFEIAARVVFEGRQHQERQENKVYWVKHVDSQWQIVALNDATADKLDDWLEAMKVHAEADVADKGGEADPDRKTTVEERYLDLVAAKKTDIQNLSRDENDPDIKKLLQQWILPIAHIESPTAKKLPAFWVRGFREGEPQWSKSVEVLVGMGQTAVPELIAGLKDKDPLVRSGSAAVLGKIGSPVREVGFAPLFAALKDADPAVRRQVAGALEKIGPLSPAEIPALCAGLKDQTDDVRKFALFDLEQLGPRARDAVPFLIAGLQEKNNSHRRGMVIVLGKIGPEARTAVPDLVLGFRDPKEDFRIQCALATARIGEAAVPVLQGTLRDSDANARSMAAWALGEIGLPAKTAIPGLIELLKDSAPPVRAKAAASLGNMAEEARLALPMLAQTLNDQDRQVRLQTIQALTKIGPVSIFLHGLVNALEENDAELNRAAESALNKMGLLDASAVPILKKVLGSSKLPLRLFAAKALGTIGPPARDAIFELSRALMDMDRAVRLEATLSLGKIGPAAGSAHPLVAALLDKDPEVSARALDELEKVDRFVKADVPGLLLLLPSNQPAVRVFAASALGKIGPEARDAVPLLRKGLTDAEAKVRRSAATALGKIGPPAWSAAPDLALALKDRDIPVRKNAAAAVAAIGADAQPAFASLVQAMKDKAIQEEAFSALVQIGKRAVPDLIKAVEDKSDYAFRLRVIQALGNIGPDARDALEALTVLSTMDKYATVRQAAREAVAKIRK